MTEQLNLIEALDALQSDPDARGVQMVKDGWRYIIRREGEQGFLLRCDQIDGPLSEETHFKDEGEILAHFAFKKEVEPQERKQIGSIYAEPNHIPIYKQEIRPEEAALGKTDPRQEICLSCGAPFYPTRESQPYCPLCDH